MNKIKVMVSSTVNDLQGERDAIKKAYVLEESRYNKTSTIVAGQIVHTKWYDLFIDSTITDAIMEELYTTRTS